MNFSHTSTGRLLLDRQQVRSTTIPIDGLEIKRIVRGMKRGFYLKLKFDEVQLAGKDIHRMPL